MFGWVEAGPTPSEQVGHRKKCAHCGKCCVYRPKTHESPEKRQAKRKTTAGGGCATLACLAVVSGMSAAGLDDYAVKNDKATVGGVGRVAQPRSVELDVWHSHGRWSWTCGTATVGGVGRVAQPRSVELDVWHSRPRLWSSASQILAATASTLPSEMPGSLVTIRASVSTS